MPRSWASPGRAPGRSCRSDLSPLMDADHRCDGVRGMRGHCQPESATREPIDPLPLPPGSEGVAARDAYRKMEGRSAGAGHARFRACLAGLRPDVGGSRPTAWPHFGVGPVSRPDGAGPGIVPTGPRPGLLGSRRRAPARKTTGSARCGGVSRIAADRRGVGRRVSHSGRGDREFGRSARGADVFWGVANSSPADRRSPRNPTRTPASPGTSVILAGSSHKTDRRSRKPGRERSPPGEVIQPRSRSGGRDEPVRPTLAVLGPGCGDRGASPPPFYGGPGRRR